MRKYPLVEIEWEDAYSTGSRQEKDNPLITGAYLRSSVGYLLQRRPRIVLAMTIDDGKFVQDTITIPSKTVRKLTRLKEDGKEN